MSEAAKKLSRSLKHSRRIQRQFNKVMAKKTEKAMADIKKLRLAVETLKGYPHLQPGMDGYAALQVIDQAIGDIPPDNPCYKREYVSSCKHGHARLTIPAPGGKFDPQDAADVYEWLVLIQRQLHRVAYQPEPAKPVEATELASPA